jgi:hypothetical protein
MYTSIARAPSTHMMDSCFNEFSRRNSKSASELSIQHMNSAFSMTVMLMVNHDDHDDDGMVATTTTTSFAPVRGAKEPVAPVN